VARKGDGWLSRGMGGYVGGRMANLVVRPLATGALWVRIQKSLQDHKTGDICAREW
jgi:hypothetical protein